MKKRSRLEQPGDFVLGKGFYVVLLLCVATIGVSSYAPVHNFTAKPTSSSSAGGSASVVLAMGPGTVAEVKQDGLMGATVVVDQGAACTQPMQTWPPSPR